MDSRAFTLALIIAGIAMFMVHSYVESTRTEYIKEYGRLTPVVVANQDITQFEQLDDRKVLVINVPKKFVLPGAFKSVEGIYNTITTIPILKGEQITKPRVTYPGLSTGLSRQVSTNKRAFSLNVSEDQAVSKLIKPGDRVDVLAKIDYAGGRKDMQKVKTILQDVLVLSTGLAITNNLPVVKLKSNNKEKQLNLNTYSSFNTITLELDPYQAQKMIFLTSVIGAKPYLTLRNNNDKVKVRIRSTNLKDMLGEDAAEAAEYFKNKNDRANRNRR